MAKSQAATLRVTTGRLWSAPRLHDAGTVIRKTPEGLDVGLFPGDTLHAFERELAGHLKAVGTLPRLRFRVDTASVALVSLTIALAITLLLGVLATYEDLIAAALVARDFGSAWRVLLLLATAAFLVVGITLFPSLLSSADDNRVRDFLTRWYNRDDRVRHRLHYALRTLSAPGAAAVVVWNPFSAHEASWVWRSFLPAVLALELPVTIHVKTDELDALLAALHAIDATRAPAHEHHAVADASAPSDAASPPAAMYPMLSPSEQALLDTLCVLSTHHVPDAWGNAERTQRLRGLISLDLAAFVVTHGMGGRDAAQAPVDVQLLHVFFRRCVTDYRLAIRFTDRGDRYWRLVNAVPRLVPEARRRQRQLQIANCIETEAFDLVRDVGDPIGLLLAYASLDDAGGTPKLRRAMLSAMIERALAVETYFLMDYFVGIVEKETARGEFARREDFLRLLPLATLHDLVPLLERAGYFQDGIAVAELLSPTHPSGTALMKARLLERLGRYHDGLALLVDLERSLDACAAPDTPEGRDFALRLALATSWTIVSGRLESERDYGKQQLQRAGRIVQRVCQAGGNCDPDLLWHYYNNLAQYDEWDGNLDSCIINHLNCRNLPSIELKWTSGTHVNLGIAYRERFNRRREVEDLERAVAHASRGVDIKRELGDLDELPIALHNLAYTCLIQFVARNDPDALNRARDHADEGLHLLAATGSTKKRGQLLVEAWVACTLCGEHARAAALERELAGWRHSNEGTPDARVVEQIAALASNRGPELPVGHP